MQFLVKLISACCFEKLLNDLFLKWPSLNPFVTCRMYDSYKNVKFNALSIHIVLEICELPFYSNKYESLDKDKCVYLHI